MLTTIWAAFFRTNERTKIIFNDATEIKLRTYVRFKLTTQFADLIHIFHLLLIHPFYQIILCAKCILSCESNKVDYFHFIMLR